MEFDIAGIILTICGIALPLLLIPYILNGIGLYGIAKNNNISGGWLAFMPFARKYLEGKIAGEISFGERTIENPGLWLLRLPIISFVLTAPIALFLAFTLIQGAYTLLENIDFIVADMDLAFFYSMLTTLIIGGAVLLILSIICKAIICCLTGLIRYNIHKRYMNGNKAIGHMLLGMFIPMYQIIYYLVLSRATPLDTKP